MRNDTLIVFHLGISPEYLSSISTEKYAQLLVMTEWIIRQNNK